MKKNKFTLEPLPLIVSTSLVILVIITLFFVKRGPGVNKLKNTFAYKSAEVVCESLSAPLYECKGTTCTWKCISENIAAEEYCSDITCPQDCVKSVDFDGCDFCVCKR